jgi:hypothetical protein
MVNLKMLFSKIPKEDMDLLKEKWKISIKNIRISYQKIGGLIVFCCMSFAQLQDFILHKRLEERMTL